MQHSLLENILFFTIVGLVSLTVIVETYRAISQHIRDKRDNKAFKKLIEAKPFVPFARYNKEMDMVEVFLSDPYGNYIHKNDYITVLVDQRACDKIVGVQINKIKELIKSA